MDEASRGLWPSEGGCPGRVRAGPPAAEPPAQGVGGAGGAAGAGRVGRGAGRARGSAHLATRPRRSRPCPTRPGAGSRILAGTGSWSSYRPSVEGEDLAGSAFRERLAAAPGRRAGPPNDLVGPHRDDLGLRMRGWSPGASPPTVRRGGRPCACGSAWRPPWRRGRRAADPHPGRPVLGAGPGSPATAHGVAAGDGGRARRSCSRCRTRLRSRRAPTCGGWRRAPLPCPEKRGRGPPRPGRAVRGAGGDRGRPRRALASPRPGPGTQTGGRRGRGRRWWATAGRGVPAGVVGAGTLLVRVSSAAWAIQVRFLDGEIRGRANETIGAGRSARSGWSWGAQGGREEPE